MSDFAAAGTAHEAGLSYREGREVVLVDVAARNFTDDVVKGLLLGQRAQGADRQDLGLATSEETGSMGAREDACASRELADLGGLTTIRADAFLHNHGHELFFLHLLHDGVEVVAGAISQNGQQLFLVLVLAQFISQGFLGNFGKSVVTLFLVDNAHALGNGFAHVLAESRVQGLVGDEERILFLGLTSLFDKLIDGRHDLFDHVVGFLDGFQNQLLGNLIGTGFDHTN